MSIVVGVSAGISGLTTACRLAREGLRAEVIEAALLLSPIMRSHR